jgi:predicted phosphodiesterase
MSSNPKGDLVKKVILENPELGTNTIAKLLHSTHPLWFASYEQARSAVRYYRGEHHKDQKTSHVVGTRTEEQKKESNGWRGAPKSDYEEVPEFVMPTGNNRILVLSDIHLPYHDERALDIAIDYGIKNKPNAIILNGDTMDMYQASRFIKDPTLRNLAGEIEMTREFIQALKNEFSCPIYFKMGNHEDRWQNYLKVSAPELLGIPEFHLSSLLRFGEFGVTEVKSKQIIKAGKLTICHGHEMGHAIFSPVNPARGLYMKAKVSAICGHHHQTSEHSEKDMAGNVVTTWSMGALCGLSPEYFPFNKWTHGFCWVDTDSSGEFEVKNMRIVDGKIR